MPARKEDESTARERDGEFWRRLKEIKRAAMVAEQEALESRSPSRLERFRDPQYGSSSAEKRLAEICEQMMRESAERRVVRAEAELDAVEVVASLLSLRDRHREEMNRLHDEIEDLELNRGLKVPFIGRITTSTG